MNQKGSGELLWDFFAATVRACFPLLMAVSIVAIMFLSISENVTCIVGKVFLSVKNNEYLISMISTDTARKSIVQFDFERDKHFCARSAFHEYMTPSKTYYCA